jgi:hypothetical protein
VDKNAIFNSLRSWARFWIPFLGLVFLIIFLILATMAEWRQTEIQLETLAEAKLVKSQKIVVEQNNVLLNKVSEAQSHQLEILNGVIQSQNQNAKILEAINKLQVQVLHQQEIMVKNQEYLKQNRELWNIHFDELRKNLQDFKNEFGGHVNEWELYKAGNVKEKIKK